MARSEDEHKFEYRWYQEEAHFTRNLSKTEEATGWSVATPIGDPWTEERSLPFWKSMIGGGGDFKGTSTMQQFRIEDEYKVEEVNEYRFWIKDDWAYFTTNESSFEMRERFVDREIGFELEEFDPGSLPDLMPTRPVVNPTPISPKRRKKL